MWNRNAYLVVVFTMMALAGATILLADSKEEAIQGDPFDPKDIRAFLKVEAQGRSPEISEKHVAEWEACGETYRAGVAVFQRKRGAVEEYETATVRLDQIGKRLSPENPFQLNVLLLKCKGLTRTGKTTETRACLLAMADKMSAVRSAYGEKCPLIDRIYLPLVTNELGRATVLRKEDSQRVLDYIAHWTANADPTVRTNAWLALGRFWDAAERRDLDKLAHCMGNYYRSLLLLFSSVRDPQRDFWAVYRDQVRYAHSVLLKGGRPDLANEFVKEIEPSMLMTDQAIAWLQDIQQAAARPGEPNQPPIPSANGRVQDTRTRQMPGASAVSARIAGLASSRATATSTASCGCGCSDSTATKSAQTPARTVNLVAGAKVTSSTAAGACCTTGCVTTAVAGTIKRP